MQAGVTPRVLAPTELGSTDVNCVSPAPSAHTAPPQATLVAGVWVQRLRAGQCTYADVPSEYRTAAVRQAAVSSFGPTAMNAIGREFWWADDLMVTLVRQYPATGLDWMINNIGDELARPGFGRANDAIQAVRCSRADLVLMRLAYWVDDHQRRSTGSGAEQAWQNYVGLAGRTMQQYFPVGSAERAELLRRLRAPNSLLTDAVLAHETILRRDRETMAMDSIADTVARGEYSPQV